MIKPRLNTTKSIVLVAATMVSATAADLAAQVTPERLYNGLRRALPMNVERPAGAEGDLSLKMLEADTAEVVSSAEVSEGGVDIAALFPSIWTERMPPVRYLQLYAGADPVGPAVVMQPTITPMVATLNGRVPQFQRRGAKFAGYRTYVDKHVVLETTQGRITIRLRPDVAPNTAWNFRHLAEGGFYTDILVHRIIERREGREPFVIQFGDPSGDGDGGPGYFIDLEQSNLPHDFGVMSMARSTDPNSNGSQVFIALSRAGTNFLDGNYTTFAEAVDGGQTIVDISRVDVDSADKPLDPKPYVQAAFLEDAPPYPNKPARVVRPAEGSGR